MAKDKCLNRRALNNAQSKNKVCFKNVIPVYPGIGDFLRKFHVTQPNHSMKRIHTELHPMSNLFSSKKLYVGTSKLKGAGPLRILPEMS